MKRHQYTWYGVGAIALWSTVVALVRVVAEHFGPVGGAASIYTVATIMLLFTGKTPAFSSLSKPYLLVGGLLFASYEICLSLALGWANSRHQAVEMMVINYLWPALTILIAVLGSAQKPSAWLYLCVLLTFTGVAWSITGDTQLTLPALIEHVQTNPLSYSLALFGALLWALYCNVTKRFADGNNAVSYFFALTSCGLWLQFALTEQPTINLNPGSVMWLILAGGAMAGGYALWNKALMGGNMLLLATLSYFTPILSALFSAFLLGISLSVSFWQGVVMVTVGSLLCWWVTRDVKPNQQTLAAMAEHQV
ncbi:Uncharacterized membrane protein [Vibrio xiamenensis]|uniref:Uncharacterized membrane protein n=1 Tax=Vibrio xiamenensis TaxID=861298 RepID=A0A1G8ARN9_9VIBR|nr:aromatic amino acid DMT transporter YddG [Vibrio xiamenensis]SDH23732.1 Uncharacterized membrane protein [Vibrio xiamenensis]